MSRVKLVRNLPWNEGGRNVPAVCKLYPLLLSASTHWNIIKIEAANCIGTVTFFHSSKNRDTWCNNICVNVSTCVKDDESDSPKKLSQSQKKKSGFSQIELYVEFKSNVNDDPFRDDENNNLFMEKLLTENAVPHTSVFSAYMQWICAAVLLGARYGISHLMFQIPG